MPTNKPSLVLASASPRRKELLGRLGLPFSVKPVDTEEDMSRPLPPQDLAVALAEEKLEACLQQYPDFKTSYIITADTFISHRGSVLGKPASEENARSMLNQLSGQTHQVFTGVCLYNPENSAIARKAAVTEVTFSPLSPETIENYLKTGEWNGAAGAYRIQGCGETLIFKINGSYSNVMGLPLNLLYGMLRFGNYPV